MSDEIKVLYIGGNRDGEIQIIDFRQVFTIDYNNYYGFCVTDEFRIVMHRDETPPSFEALLDKMLEAKTKFDAVKNLKEEGVITNSMSHGKWEFNYTPISGKQDVDVRVHSTTPPNHPDPLLQGSKIFEIDQYVKQYMKTQEEYVLGYDLVRNNASEPEPQDTYRGIDDIIKDYLDSQRGVTNTPEPEPPVSAWDEKLKKELDQGWDTWGRIEKKHKKT